MGFLRIFHNLSNQDLSLFHDPKAKCSSWQYATREKDISEALFFRFFFVSKVFSRPWGHWNIRTENSGRKTEQLMDSASLLFGSFCLAFSILVD